MLLRKNAYKKSVNWAPYLQVALMFVFSAFVQPLPVFGS